MTTKSKNTRPAKGTRKAGASGAVASRPDFILCDGDGREIARSPDVNELRSRFGPDQPATIMPAALVGKVLVIHLHRGAGRWETVTRAA